LNQAAHPADETIWQRFRTGDRAALEALARRFYRPLLHYGTRFTADEELIKDSIQELFLTLWQQRGSLGETGSVKLYLFKALRHRLFKEFKRQDLFRHDWTDEELPDEAEEPPFIRQEQATHDQAQLHRLLTGLTDRQREMLYLRYYENLSNEAIAQLMGINRQSVANALHRALEKLRENWVVLVGLWLLGGCAYFTA
jgi:RNA polymerase sigma-70 factor (ECF subfamily)